MKSQGTYADLIEQLLNEELKAKALRSQTVLLKQASLPSIKTLEEYDFAFGSGARKNKIKELSSLAFISRQENVVLLGPSGVGSGKTQPSDSLAL